MTLKTRSYGLLVLLLASILSVSVRAGAAAPSYSLSVGSGSFSPNPICGGMTATAKLGATLNVQNPNQEIQESGDSWNWSASVTGYAASSQAAFGAVPSGVIPPSVGASSGSATSTVTAAASQPTSPGYYQVTVTATDSFTLTDSTTSPATVTSQSQASSTTLLITVVVVGDIQYNDPDNGWVSIPSDFTAMKGTTSPVRAIPNPSDALFPSGQLVWGGIASGTGTTATATFSTDSTSVGDEVISVTLGGGTSQSTSTNHLATANAASASQGASRQATTYRVIPKLAPYDMFPNRSLTSLGVGEQALCTVEVKPVNSPMPATFWTIQGLPAPGGGSQGSGQLNGNGLLGLPAIFWAGTTPGSNFTLQLSINSGPSKGKSVNTGNMSIVAPAPVNMKRDPLSGDYHQQYTASAGFRGIWALSPSNVSFNSIEFGEKNCMASIATGCLAASANKLHMPGFAPTAINYGPVSNIDGFGNTPIIPSDHPATPQDILDDSNAFRQFPHDTSGNQWEDSSGVWVVGDATYNIPQMYHVKQLDGSFAPDKQVLLMPLVLHVGSDGTATITKDAGFSIVKISAPTSGM